MSVPPTKKLSTLDDFEIIDELGNGAYSSVLLVKRLEDSQLYALK